MCIFFQVCILTRFNFLTKEPKFTHKFVVHPPKIDIDIDLFPLSFDGRGLG